MTFQKMDNRIPTELANLVKKSLQLQVLSGNLSDELVRESARIITECRGQSWNWDQHWAAHTYLCYTQNFFKAYKCGLLWVEQQKLPKTLTILDLGCGAGASTAGLIASLRDQVETIIVHGVDANGKMLDFFENTLVHWALMSSKEKKAKIKITFENENANRYLQSSEDVSYWDIILCSYLFCGDPTLEKSVIKDKNSIVLDLPQKGYSTVSVGKKRYKLKYDSRKSINTDYLLEIGIFPVPNDWYPIFEE